MNFKDDINILTDRMEESMKGVTYIWTNLREIIFKNFTLIIMFIIIVYLFFSVSNKDQNNYIFKPRLKVSSLFAIIILLIAVHTLTLYYSYIQSNWESEKCAEGLHFFAPLFGKNSKQTFKECNRNTINELITNELSSHVQESRANATSIQDLNHRLDGIDTDLGISKKTLDTNKASYAEVSQPKIKTLSNTMDKLLGSIFLNTKINKGVLNSVQTLEDSSIGNIVKKFNGVDSNAFDNK